MKENFQMNLGGTIKCCNQYQKSKEFLGIDIWLPISYLKGYLGGVAFTDSSLKHTFSNITNTNWIRMLFLNLKQKRNFGANMYLLVIDNLGTYYCKINPFPHIKLVKISQIG